MSFTRNEHGEEQGAAEQSSQVPNSRPSDSSVPSAEAGRDVAPTHPLVLCLAGCRPARTRLSVGRPVRQFVRTSGANCNKRFA